MTCAIFIMLCLSSIYLCMICPCSSSPKVSNVPLFFPLSIGSSGVMSMPTALRMSSPSSLCHSIFGKYPMPIAPFLVVKDQSGDYQVCQIVKTTVINAFIFFGGHAFPKYLIVSSVKKKKRELRETSPLGVGFKSQPPHLSRHTHTKTKRSR